MKRKPTKTTTSKLEEFITKHYALETNIPEPAESLLETLAKADVIFLGETHHDTTHQEWNGKIINALWTPQTLLLVEHRPIGNQEQLSGVQPEIAKKAKQWDLSKSGTADQFNKLMRLSLMIDTDIHRISFPESNPKSELPKATKELVKKGTQLIEQYIVQPHIIEEAWSVIDGQMAKILDEAEEPQCNYERIDLLFKQAYLRVWVLAAKESLDQFLVALEGEMVERNDSMTQKISEGLKQEKVERILLVAGSDHFNELLTNAQLKQVENPVFAFIKGAGLRYVVLVPAHDSTVEQAREMSKRIFHIADADTDEIQGHAYALIDQLEDIADKAQYELYLTQIAELKELCQRALRDVKIQSHDEAAYFQYSTGAICLRVHDLAKTIQLWCVIVDLLLADPKREALVGDPLLL